MNNLEVKEVEWELVTVTSPDLADPVAVVVARDIPYFPDANRFQNLSIYLPRTEETLALVGTIATSLPRRDAAASVRYLVHVHGGAWRDPQLTSKSIEPTVAHAFSAFEALDAIMAIVSLNYSVSQYPSHPSHPYDVSEHSDPSREAVHPQHVSDVLHGLALLRSFGLQDESYIFSGHSCGACIAFQTILQSPGYFGIENIGDAPAPAALIGLNGLYDLPDLVDGLGSSHEHLRREYDMLITNAFGPDKTTWPAASPTRFDPDVIGERISDGKVPRLVVIDQSNKDKLVPVNQKDRLIAQLSQVFEMHVVEGQRCDGTHAEPWEQGTIWLSALDAVGLLERQVSST